MKQHKNAPIFECNKHRFSFLLLLQQITKNSVALINTDLFSYISGSQKSDVGLTELHSFPGL